MKNHQKMALVPPSGFFMMLSLTRFSRFLSRPLTLYLIGGRARIDMLPVFQ